MPDIAEYRTEAAPDPVTSRDDSAAASRTFRDIMQRK